MGRNRDGSRDIGLMQINSSWLPTLVGHGINDHHLFDACTSIHVGACVFRPIVTGRSGNVTDRSGIVTEGVLEGFEGCV